MTYSKPTQSSFASPWRRLLCALALLATSQLAIAQTSAPVRLRGSIEAFDAASITVRERSGELIALQLPAKYTFQEVLPIEISAIAPNAFIGTAAVPGKDGTWQALEVVVFPESARGTGEGHYPWDLKPDSTMTNATVADLVRTADARRLTLRYKDGEKVIVVPDNVPVVTFRPGDPALIKTGARVFIVATVVEGKPTISRLVIGRDGFAPPM
jgi:hypothetical protein